MSKHRKSSPEIDRSRIVLPSTPRAMSHHMWSCASTFACWRRSHSLVVRLHFLSPYKDMSSSTQDSNINEVSPVPWPQPKMYTTSFCKSCLHPSKVYAAFAFPIKQAVSLNPSSLESLLPSCSQMPEVSPTPCHSSPAFPLRITRWLQLWASFLDRHGGRARAASFFPIIK